MKFPWAKATWEATIKANVALSIALAGMTFITAISVWHSLSIKDRVVLTPPSVDKEMMVSWNAASESYLKSFGLYVATLVGNINATNSGFVVESLSTITAPESYSALRQEILAVVNTKAFKEGSSSTRFSPVNIFYEKETNLVYITGTYDILAAGQVPKTEPIVYEFDIRIVEGRPYVFTMTSYSDSVPHNAEWKTNHPDGEVK